MTEILVVDDDPRICDLLEVFLADEGYEIRRAADGLEALAKIENGVPDLIVTDLMMPVLDGRGLAQEVRTSSTNEHIPILLISAAYRKQADDPFTAVLAKPFDIDTFITTIRTLLV